MIDAPYHASPDRYEETFGRLMDASFRCQLDADLKALAAPALSDEELKILN